MSEASISSTEVELASTSSISKGRNKSLHSQKSVDQHHRTSVNILYGMENGNSFCPDELDPEELVEAKRRTTKTKSLMANHQSVLQGRVEMMNKARENTTNHQHDSSETFSFKSQKQIREESKCCYCLYIINPLSLGHSLWDLYIALVLIVSLVSLPVGMAFDEVGNSMFVMNIVIDFFFICDIVVTLMTGFVDENDALIMKPRPIITNYIKSWFFMDVVSSVPIDLILRLIEESQKSDDMDAAELANLTKLFKMMRLVRMLKLVRLFRLSRVAKYVRSFRLWLQHHLMFQIPQAFLSISKLVVVLAIVAHWLGCIFFMVSKQFDFPYDSWVVRSGLIDRSTGEQYVWSFLKAFYMIIGGEEMLPSGNGIGCENLDEYCAVESWMSLFALYIGCVFSALLISEIGIIVTSLDRSRQLYHDKLQEANEYMRANKLSPELRERVREYFGLRYSDQKMFHEQMILEDLSPNLRTQIREEVSSNIVIRVPLLHENDKNHAFIDGIVTQLKGPLICFVKEVIFYEGTTGHEMYFIYSGVIGIFSKAGTGPGDDPEGVAVAAISNGCYFGEVALLKNCRRTATARSETISVIHTLDAAALAECLADVPNIKEYMEKVAQQRKQRIAQVDPNYEGEVDHMFESDEYVDLEDAKTPMFKYDQEASRDAARKNRTRRSGIPKGGLHFDKKLAHAKTHGKALARLREVSTKAVQQKRQRRRSSMAKLQSPLSDMTQSETSSYPDSLLNSPSRENPPVQEEKEATEKLEKDNLDLAVAETKVEVVLEEEKKQETKQETEQETEQEIEQETEQEKKKENDPAAIAAERRKSWKR